MLQHILHDYSQTSIMIMKPYFNLFCFVQAVTKQDPITDSRGPPWDYAAADATRRLGLRICHSEYLPPLLHSGGSRAMLDPARAKGSPASRAG